MQRATWQQAQPKTWLDSYGLAGNQIRWLKREIQLHSILSFSRDSGTGAILAAGEFIHPNYSFMFSSSYQQLADPPCVHVKYLAGVGTT